MGYIMNQDRCMAPRPVTFIAPVDELYRGMFVEITGMAANNVWLAGEDDFEAYKVKLADADTEKKNLLINTTVPKQYDERLDERDFVCNKDHVCRGHYITTGDEYTLPVDFVDGELTVGAEVVLAADGILEVVATNPVGEEVGEEVGATNPVGEVIRVYTWNGQNSCMIRFY